MQEEFLIIILEGRQNKTKHFFIQERMYKEKVEIFFLVVYLSISDVQEEMSSCPRVQGARLLNMLLMNKSIPFWNNGDNSSF